MTAQELARLKIKAAIDECSIHQQRLHQAWLEAADFPLQTHTSLQPLSDAQVRVLDQLVFRFGRLQDAIGTRLLPAALQLVQEWAENESFLDRLNRAEKLGVLPSADQWQLFRELRNQTAHEYPAQPELMLANLRRLVEHVPQLEQAHAQLAAFVEQRSSLWRTTLS